MMPATMLFRLWLALFPPRYRRRFADEALAGWERARSNASLGGRSALAAFWLHNSLDVVSAAGHEWLSVLRGPVAAPRAGRLPGRGAGVLDGVSGDVRNAARTLARRPLLTGIIMLTLALGIGANAAVFSLLDAVLLHPLPVRDPATVVSVFQALNAHTPYFGTAYPTWQDLRRESKSLQDLAAFTVLDVGLRAGTASDRVAAGLVTGNYFAVLGVNAQHGRLLQESDATKPGDAPVVVLGDALWHCMFGGDAAVVGRSIELGGYPFTVIGIAPRGFRGTELSSVPELFIPVTMVRQVARSGLYAQEVLATRWFSWLRMVGRLRPPGRDGEAGALMAQASAELNATMAGIRAEFPAEFSRRDPTSGRISLLPVNAGVLAGSRTELQHFLAMPLAVVALTLLIACLNVATLLLVRAAERTREFGVRAAIGAGRARLARQVLTESLLLAGGGAVLSLGFIYSTTTLLRRFTLPGDVRIDGLDLALDTRVVWVALALALLTALLFGVMPAWRASRLDPKLAISGQGALDAHRGGRLRTALVSAQVGLSLVLVIGATLFLRSMGRGLHTDLGFNGRGVAAILVRAAPAGLRCRPSHGVLRGTAASRGIVA